MSTHDRPPIGEQIRRARLEEGWSQNELAWRTHVSQTEISKYEKGVIKPSWDRFLVFAEVFGWELPFLGELAAGSDEAGVSRENPWNTQTPVYQQVSDLEPAMA